MKNVFIVLKNLILFVLLFIFILFCYSTSWAIETYGGLNFNEIVFHLKSNIDGTEATIINSFLFNSLVPTIILCIIIFVFLKYLYYLIKDKNHYFAIYFFNKKVSIKLSIIRRICSIVIILLSLSITLYKLNDIHFFDYMKSEYAVSTFIDKNYKDPKKVKITFPKTKRNLIYIFVESLESSYFSRDLGGLKENNILEPLTKLTNDNINFSNTEKFGGAKDSSYTGFTTAGMVAQTSGLPLKTTLVVNEHLQNFLDKAYSIGDILEKENYNQELMIGSKKNFGSRDTYFKSHGNYKIYDYNYAKKHNKIANDYLVWWGFEDKKLFEFAKEELLNLSNQDKPFNFTLLTANTHFQDGYIDENCNKKFEGNYDNSIYCSSYEINEFISWIKNQDFYDNTSIVISGDHLTMQKDYFLENDNRDRTIYNLFINSKKENVNNKNRIFTTLDMFPTTLSSLDVTIDGDRLGLGTNLFSNKKTLAEKYGLDKMNEEIKKRSILYNKLFFGE